MTSGKNMWRHHTIRWETTISKKWTFVHTEISFHHTINIWSHRKKFVHTINFQDHTVIILFTPWRCWSHSWKFCSHHLHFVHTIHFANSHRHNFVHTINMLFTLLKFLFTPSKFCSHHLFSESHWNNFVILFTPSRFYSHSGNFGSHHLNFVHTISIMFTLKNRVVHTQHIFNVCDQAHCTCVY